MSAPKSSQDREVMNTLLDRSEASELAISRLESPHNEEALKQLLFVSEGAEKMAHSSLCYMCFQIFRRWDSIMSYFNQPKAEYYQRFRHWDHIFQLELSAERGCGVCAQLLRGCRSTVLLQGLKLRTATILDIDPNLINGSLYISSWRLPALELELSFGFPYDDLDYSPYKNRVCDFRVTLVPYPKGDPTLNLLLDKLIIILMASSDTHLEIHSALSLNSKDGLPLARQWLRNCCQSHEFCKPSEFRSAPSRLLCVRGAPRLFLAAELQENQEYATLSHCWGTTEFSVLKNSILETFRRSVPNEALTKTFKDAIEICRYLEIDFLWIDSLCIVQDDPRDWQRESAKMASIYGNSKLNIAADGAKDGTVGCFLNRKPTWRSRVSTIVKGDHVVYESVSNNSGHIPLFDDEPLRNRGWAVQEYLLPARTLHFTSTQVVWECNGNKTCETLPNNEITDMQQTIDAYVAGLWRKDLEVQLCWYACEGDGWNRTVPQYRAPSWSWASTDAEIDNYSGEDDILVKITQAQTFPLGENPLGQLSGGYLRLCCQKLHPTHTDNTVDVLSLEQKGLRWDGGERIPIRYDRAEGHTGQVYILPISQERRPYKDDHWFRGLVLVRTNMIRGQYKRVGMFMSWVYPKIPDPELELHIEDSHCWGDPLAFIEVQNLEDGTKQGLIEIV